MFLLSLFLTDVVLNGCPLLCIAMSYHTHDQKKSSLFRYGAHKIQVTYTLFGNIFIFFSDFSEIKIIWRILYCFPYFEILYETNSDAWKIAKIIHKTTIIFECCQQFILFFYLHGLFSSVADNLCKQYRMSWSGSKPSDTLIVFLKYFNIFCKS